MDFRSPAERQKQRCDDAIDDAKNYLEARKITEALRAEAIIKELRDSLLGVLYLGYTLSNEELLYQDLWRKDFYDGMHHLCVLENFSKAGSYSGSTAPLLVKQTVTAMQHCNEAPHSPDWLLVESLASRMLTNQILSIVHIIDIQQYHARIGSDHAVPDVRMAGEALLQEIQQLQRDFPTFQLQISADLIESLKEAVSQQCE